MPALAPLFSTKLRAEALKLFTSPLAPPTVEKPDPRFRTLLGPLAAILALLPPAKTATIFFFAHTPPSEDTSPAEIDGIEGAEDAEAGRACTTEAALSLTSRSRIGEGDTVGDMAFELRCDDEDTEGVH